MKKTIFTLNVNDYSSEITKITYPFLLQYATKIGATFYIIRERKFPDFPVTYEKFQIHELGKDNDWNIFIDSDALVHPDMFDITEVLPSSTVLTCGKDFAPMRFRYDEYFRKDGRHIGAGNWFTVASKKNIDLWHPLDDMPLSEAVSNIFPTIIERNKGVDAKHLIDDYVVSRNIAKYGLPFTTFKEILDKYGNPGEFLFHEYLYTTEDKIQNLKKVIDLWRGVV
jgi:hypothetical protein